jgi:TRAP-type mannitol/chloroaromatic compound transport system permease small subunit
MAGRIFDRLVSQYGEDAVFIDIDSMPIGLDFRDHLEGVLRDIDVLLAIVGPMWMGPAGTEKPRIFDADDFVRIEVEAALKRGIPVIPVLIDRAEMPKAELLPASIREFAFRNGITVDSGRDFRIHMDRLISAVDRLLASASRGTGVETSDESADKDAQETAASARDSVIPPQDHHGERAGTAHFVTEELKKSATAMPIVAAADVEGEGIAATPEEIARERVDRANTPENGRDSAQGSSFPTSSLEPSDSEATGFLGSGGALYIRFADSLSAWVAKALAWCAMVMTLGVSYEVVVRRLMGAPTVWAFDVSYMMYGTLFMLGGAYTLSRDAHVRADIFYRLMKPRSQAALELVLYFLFFFPGVLALIFAGWKYVSRSWRYLEVSTMSPANIPIYQFKSVIIVAGVLLVIQGIAQVFRCIICLRQGDWPAPPRDVEELEKLLLQEKSLEVLRHSGEAVDVVVPDTRQGSSVGKPARDA